MELVQNKGAVLNAEQQQILRRKVEDKMRKDPAFCLRMITWALREGGIKHRDIISYNEMLMVRAGIYNN